MSDPLNDLLDVIKQFPPKPQKSYIVAAVRDENRRLIPANDTLRKMYDQMTAGGMEVHLSEHAPATNKDGEMCIFELPKPSLLDLASDPLKIKIPVSGRRPYRHR